VSIETIKPDKNKNVLIYTKKSVCDLCKGACCKTYAGIYAPEDFNRKITTAFLIHLLLTKMFTIESMDDGTDSDYYLRPRYFEEEPINPSLYGGGVCINWNGDVGCLLSESDRPYQCRTLIPLPERGSCNYKPSDKASKSDMVKRWDDYQDDLRHAITSFSRVSKNILYNFDEFGRCDIYDGIDEKMDAIKELIKLKK
jgi:hypothetical protein